MTATKQAHFDNLYNLHLSTLKLRGMSDKTIDSYAQAVWRVSSHFDCCPDQSTTEQPEGYFAELVDSHSWSTVKIDRNGLQFFWKYVLCPDCDETTFQPRSCGHRSCCQCQNHETSQWLDHQFAYACPSSILW